MIRRFFTSPDMRVSRNATANALGRSWSMLMNFAFVPIYINLLGIEAYGVIAFFSTLIALFGFLDLGLSATLNRELARRSNDSMAMESAHDVVRTMETIYWVIGIIISACVIGAAPLIASHWLKAPGLSSETLVNSIRLMGVVIALQWPTGLYAGGLSGLQRQVVANAIDVGLSTLRGVGAVLILWFLSRSIQAFFIWQTCIVLAMVIILRRVLLRALGKPKRPARFDREVLREMTGFALGMTALSIVSIAVMYSDKVVLTTMLPLADYGRYMLANTLAATSATFALAVFGAMYPHLTRLVAAGDNLAVAKSYHAGTQMIALTVFPLAAVIMMFSNVLIEFWTGSAQIAQVAGPITSLLVIGAALNAVMLLPYALQLAHGSTRMTLISNIISVVILVPLTVVLTRSLGAYGAAFAWPLLNLGYLLVLAPLVHHRFLPGEMRAWYLRDLAPPFLAALTVTGLARTLLPHDASPLIGFLLAGASGALALIAAGASTSRGILIARQYWLTLRTALGQARTG